MTVLIIFYELNYIYPHVKQCGGDTTALTAEDTH